MLNVWSLDNFWVLLNCFFILSLEHRRLLPNLMLSAILRKEAWLTMNTVDNSCLCQIIYCCRLALDDIKWRALQHPSRVKLTVSSHLTDGGADARLADSGMNWCSEPAPRRQKRFQSHQHSMRSRHSRTIPSHCDSVRSAVVTLVSMYLEYLPKYLRYLFTLGT